MNNRINPVLVIFELEFLTPQGAFAWEALNSLGVLPIPKLRQTITEDSFEDIKLMEVWPSSDCEIAFRNNILPEMEQAGVRVRYEMYPIRRLGPREIDCDYHASRLMLYN